MIKYLIVKLNLLNYCTCDFSKRSLHNRIKISFQDKIVFLIVATSQTQSHMGDATNLIN